MTAAAFRLLQKAAAALFLSFTKESENQHHPQGFESARQLLIREIGFIITQKIHMCKDTGVIFFHTVTAGAAVNACRFRKIIILQGAASFKTSS